MSGPKKKGTDIVTVCDDGVVGGCKGVGFRLHPSIAASWKKKKKRKRKSDSFLMGAKLAVP